MKFFSKFALLGFLASTNFLAAEGETRNWKSHDGAKTLKATYLSHDQNAVQLRDEAGKDLRIALENLHADELAYLEELSKPPAPEVEGNAFGPLNFGDSRDEVMEKLKESKSVKLKVAEQFLGRTGFNDAFSTSEKLGGMTFNLFFGWDEQGGLSEISLTSPALPPQDYLGPLRDSWNTIGAEFEKKFGKPATQSPYPEQSKLQDGLILASHSWQTPNGCAIYLGTAQSGESYCLNIRRVPSAAK